MNWIEGIMHAIDYIEDHLTEEIDYAEAAKRSCSSPYHFQRVFSILCGCTLGEYIRCRRLTLAGAELAGGDAKVIDVALKYGYDSPDSFAKAFRAFHGITPSEARRRGSVLRSYSRLSVKISLEGGNIMDYRIENKEAFRLLGFKRRFTGTSGERGRQEADFYMETRLGQIILRGMSADSEMHYNVMTNFGEDGFDFYITSDVGEWFLDNYKDEYSSIGSELADQIGLEVVEIPASLWLVCETKHCEWPTIEWQALRKEAVSNWLPDSDYELADSPEISVYHWYRTKKRYLERYVEIWLPIRKK